MELFTTFAFIAGLKGSQLILIIILAILLFGGVSKIPSLMRNLGKGVHSFKQGIEDAKEEMNKPVRKAGTKAAEDDEPKESTKTKDTI